MNSFFEKIGFTFGSILSDIKPNSVIISENQNLTDKLKGKTFIFDSQSHTNSSFYVVSTPLTDHELFDVKRYIWNENKYDLYFIAEEPTKDIITTLFYAKLDPYKNDNKIASFSGNEKDKEELKKINKWNFNSGTFWLAYSDFLDKVRQRTRIDKKLIEQLKDLKKKLKEELKIITLNYDEIIQALIDRTLFIKFLEDNHIINSYFYNYHFPNRFDENNPDFGYKILLKEHDKKNINDLFDKINKLFNAVLFKSPIIEEQYLTDKSLDLIYQAIRQKDWKTGQLSLFDFRFDVIPIEFISHIYEVFLEGQQADEGIYYTPDKLAHLIIDDTIKNVGTILDPSCGSGMFLILAFRKLLEIAPVKNDNVSEKIEYKSKLLKDYIYGIEKEKIAWRLSVFSLYLEVLKGINPEEIKNYIKKKLENESQQPIFPYDFAKNILHQNALETELKQKAHKDKTFDYIVGNPPFCEIKSTDEEINFINNYEITIDNETIKAKDIIGYKQMSQAFMLKLKDWAKQETRFGFVQNSSNFYNEKSNNFQKFFFRYYQVENFYELSRVKDILFRRAKESVVVIIFNNKPAKNNVVNYYPIDLGLFSETFDLLIIQEDKKVEINQQNVLNTEIVLRDYLIGNEYDLQLLEKLSKQKSLQDFLLKDKKNSSFEGLKRISNKELAKYLADKDIDFNKLNHKEKLAKHIEFAKDNYLNTIQSEYYDIPYIYQPENKIRAFKISGTDGYMNIKKVTKENFQRTRELFIYQDDNIIFNRFGKRIKACYVPKDLFFSNLIYGIKLQNKEYYYLFTAILNSDLINYYLTHKFRKRVEDNFANLDTKAIKNIPIPKNFDEELAEEISELSKQLTEGKLKYEGQVKEQLNELIFDLYELNILEKNRIKDLYAKEREVLEKDLKKYSEALLQTIELFFKNKPTINYFYNKNLPLKLPIVSIHFDTNEEYLDLKKTIKYKIEKILHETNDKFLAMKEKMYGQNSIYIIKDNSCKNWSITKAYEDGQEILKKLIR